MSPLLALLMQAGAPVPRDPYHPPPPALPACAFVRSPDATAHSLRDMPADVRAAVVGQFSRGGGLAEAGGRFEPTDNITDASVPRHRFLRAYRFGERWVVWVESGGIAYGMSVFALRPMLDAVSGATAYHVEQGTHFAGDLCKATRAILDGVKAFG